MNGRDDALMIRAPKAEDKLAMRALWDALNEETDYDPLPTQSFDEALNNAEVAFVADDHGEIVGCVYALRNPPEVVFMYGLYVQPDSRRKRTATKLTEALINWARAKGVKHAILTVEKPNCDARAFYERLGFEPYAVGMRLEVKAPT